MRRSSGTAALTVVSSMATRALLAELVAAYRERSGNELELASMGGVKALALVRGGGVLDVVVLAQEALRVLEEERLVRPGTQLAIARSTVAMAVRSGARRPEVSTPSALRRLLLRATTIGLSTGPSGEKLKALFACWGLLDELRGRIVTAPPGVPVGRLVAAGEVEIGFQQLAELMTQSGIDIIRSLPDEVQFETVFGAAVAAASREPLRASAFMAHLESQEASAAKLRHGMEPA